MKKGLIIYEKTNSLKWFCSKYSISYSPGLWRYPGDQGHKHGDLSYWIEIAQLLEKGKFDSLFLADVYGFYSAYQNSYKPAVQHAAQSPLHDPLLIISAMANSTKFLGFAGNKFYDLCTALYVSAAIFYFRSYNKRASFLEYSYLLFRF